MNIIDLISSISLSVFIYKGYKQGCIATISALAAILTGVWVAYALYTPVSQYFITSGLLEGTSPGFVKILSFSCLFIISHVCVRILGDKTQKALKMLYLHWLDRVLGGLLGCLKGVIVLSVVIFITYKVTLIIPIGQSGELFQESFIAQAIDRHMSQIIQDIIKTLTKFTH